MQATHQSPVRFVQPGSAAVAPRKNAAETRTSSCSATAISCNRMIRPAIVSTREARRRLVASSSSARGLPNGWAVYYSEFL